jgi:hypothetical protein
VDCYGRAEAKARNKDKDDQIKAARYISIRTNHHKTPITKMSLRPLRTIRPILSQIHPSQAAQYRPYSTPPNSGEPSSSTSSKPIIPIPTPSQSEPSPATPDSKKPLELPQLPRPLGVTVEPTSDPGTWSDKKERYLDEDRQKAKRKALWVDYSTSWTAEVDLAYGLQKRLVPMRRRGKGWYAQADFIQGSRKLRRVTFTITTKLGKRSVENYGQHPTPLSVKMWVRRRQGEPW